MQHKQTHGHMASLHIMGIPRSLIMLPSQILQRPSQECLMSTNSPLTDTPMVSPMLPCRHSRVCLTSTNHLRTDTTIVSPTRECRHSQDFLISANHTSTNTPIMAPIVEYIQRDFHIQIPRAKVDLTQHVLLSKEQRLMLHPGCQKNFVLSLH